MLGFEPKLMAHIISGHNKRQLCVQEPDKPCNCRRNDQCPLNRACQATSIVYAAEVSSDGHSDGPKTYIGSTEPPFKLRYGNHKTSIKLPGYRKSMGLSKHVWELKDNGKTHDIKWRVVQKAKAYSNITKRCSPCLEEKARIITADRRSSLNKRSELISKCRHQNKFMLSTPIHDLLGTLLPGSRAS